LTSNTGRPRWTLEPRATRSHGAAERVPLKND
jgi:hypothetical protein